MSKTLYRISFQQQNEIFEIYARALCQSELWGFVEVEELVFGERSQLLVDPGEERLKATFEGVKRSFIPSHSILRIDLVEKSGPAKIHASKGGVTPFPGVPPRPQS